MKNFKCDKNSAYLITDRLLRKYFTDCDIAEGYLIMTDREFVTFTDSRYFSAAKVELNNVGVKAILYNGLNDIKNYLVDNDIKTLKIDYTTTTVSEYFLYKDFGIEIKDCKNEIDNKRSVKSEEELSLIKKACEICQKAYHEGIKSVHEGMTEKELCENIESKIFEFGGEGMSFETIVAFGKNSAVPHHVTGDTKLKINQPILVDMGAIYKGYLSDMTRMAYLGKPTEKFMNCYNKVLTSATIAIEKITCGDRTDVADGYARNYLKDNDLDKLFTHSLGHGVGIEIHEHPFLSPRKSDELKNNMVFTIEPGIYIDGEFGIRIEDTVLLRNGKVERLFSDSKELIIIKN